MAFNSKSSVAITRGGLAAPGSPFSCRVYYPAVRGSKRGEIVPPVSRAARPLSLSVSDLAADVRVGDMAAMPDGSFRKVIDVRRYRTRLQCELQWIPYQALSYWSAPTLAQATSSSTFGVTDAAYSSPSTIYAYLEPTDARHLAEQAGNIDARTAQAYSTAPLKSNDAIQGDDGSIWIAVSGSEHYPVTDDYVATMRLEKVGLPGAG
ncbi:MAG: hypothetical protein P4L33_16750 [Capsulimonadaceae bacterium]|nr:hypothetical protein [Capsulimonadaceae bacterium]